MIHKLCGDSLQDLLLPPAENRAQDREIDDR